MTPSTALQSLGALLSRDSTSLRLLQVAWLAVVLAPFPAYAPGECVGEEAPLIEPLHPHVEDDFVAHLRKQTPAVRAHSEVEGVLHGATASPSTRRACRTPSRG